MLTTSSLIAPAWRRLTVALAVMVLAFAAQPVFASRASAQSTIRVVVNGTPITSNEINQRARFLRLIDRRLGGASLTRKAQQELIDEKLQFAEAQRLKLVASEQMVDAAFASIAQRVKMTPANLSRALTQSGVDPNTLKTRLRAQMLWQQAVMQRFRQQIRIADSDVVDAIKAQQKAGDKAATEQAKTIEYRLQQVILVVPAASRASALPSRRKEAEALRAQVNGCDGLVAATAGLREAVVKNVGHRTDAELPENFAAFIAETPVGKLTKAVETSNGLEMLAICDRKERESDFSIRTKVEGDLRQKQGELLTRQYMQELRRFAVIEYKR